MTCGVPDDVEVAASAAWRNIDYALSVVVPFHRYDCRLLLADLTAKLVASKELVELVFLDDGSPDRLDVDAMLGLVQTSPVPLRVARSARNLGRAGARNCLAGLARGSFLLFLDSDMLPDKPDYLERYFDEIRTGSEFVYGGRSVAQCVDVVPAHRLHWYFTKRFEQVSAAVRATNPVVYFLSSNFIVRREVIATIPLDARFTGWGLEDCEWAQRVTTVHPLKHIDNSATHLGLIDLATIKRKYVESIANFSLLIEICPELARGKSLYRVARRLARWRLGGVVETLTGAAVGVEWAPLAARAHLLRLYKAALYSRVAHDPAVSARDAAAP